MTGVPRFTKLAYRFLRYSNQRLKVSREKGIKKQQDLILEQQYDRSAEKLVIFIVPGADWNTGIDKISGGVISVVSICEQTDALKKQLNSEVVLCTLRDDHLFIKHSMFENNTNVLRFEQLPGYFSKVSNILIHIPEFLTPFFLMSLTGTDRKWFSNAQLHINILNQNISLMPGPEEIQKLTQQFNKVTITTAHQKYCTVQYRALYGVPIHKLSVWISPEQYHFKAWSEKENLLVVSPDKHESKEKIMQMLSGIDGLRVQEIRNLTYENYKLLISNAKWSLTFGEGLDGYFIEPVFSGAISFAIYNEEFFTSDFQELKTVYDSYEALAEKIKDDMSQLDAAGQFENYQQQEFSLCARYYSREVYKENIRKFYEGEYTFR